MSTDGRWCFMIFKVQLSLGVPAHWALLKQRLEAVCPSAAGEHQLWRWSSLPRDFQHPFLLQVASYDRRGFLHGARLVTCINATTGLIGPEAHHQ